MVSKFSVRYSATNHIKITLYKLQWRTKHAWTADRAQNIYFAFQLFKCSFIFIRTVGNGIIMLDSNVPVYLSNNAQTIEEIIVSEINQTEQAILS